ncbi:histidine kinase, partial [Streptomyces sp. NPDC020125]
MPAARGDVAGSSGHVLAVGTPGPRLDKLTRTLVSTGHEVSHAEPGDVSRQMRQSPPDAIVALDGADDGLELIREVRAVPAGRALPLLMVTSD